MKIDGIWKLEISGLHGWERLATVFLENGRYLSASADHYTIGKYRLEGKAFTAETSAMQYGNIRTIFGSRQEKLDTIIQGKVKKDGRIVGMVSPAGPKAPETQMRLTRLGDLDV